MREQHRVSPYPEQDKVFTSECKVMSNSGKLLKSIQMVNKTEKKKKEKRKSSFLASLVSQTSVPSATGFYSLLYI